MLIGFVGDTHDNLKAIEKAVSLFNESHTDLVIFTGDLVSPFAVEAFKDLECELKGVFGNNEGDKKTVNMKLEEINSQFSSFLEIEFGEKSIAVYHGTDPSILDCIVRSKKYDIVASGHTHTPEITLEEGTIVINPGECCGYLSSVPTVAMLDTSDMKADIHELVL